MSIHPQYAQGILDGTKKVEFRKRPIAGDVTHVIVYATAPVSAVVGAFTVKAQHTQNPRTLWRRFRDVAGIAWTDFIAYYAGRTAGTGIAVGQVLQAPEPMCLRSRLGIDRPPQSFQYVSAETAQAALGDMAVATIG
jgi:predicted transcriptional regulator